MKTIDGFITDEEIINGDYYVFETPAEIALLYCSDIRCGTEVRTYIRNLPSFDEVYECFINCKRVFIKKNRIRDICLSLFFQPYFSEFYDRVKSDKNILSKYQKKLLKKYLLNHFASEIHCKAIMDFDFVRKELKQWYIEKDIYKKSIELLALLI